MECGSKTVQCDYCKKYILRNHYDYHLLVGCEVDNAEHDGIKNN